MLPNARPHPVQILAALVVLSLPTGWAARTGLPAWLSVPAVMLLAFLPLWTALVRRRDDRDPVPAILRTGVVLLATLGICAAAGVTVTATGWVVAAAVAILILGSGSRAEVARPSTWTVGAIAIVVAIVAWRPLPLLLSSDAPAHVAAILDAIESGSMRPPDSFPGATGSDPRFGILHGFFAIVAGWTGASASEVLRWAALVFSPLWLVAHAKLMGRLGLGARVALLTALLFTLHAGVGRAFGLGAAAFPGSVAQVLCAFALAALVRDRGRLLALVLLALSALVHPFAWWSTTLVLLFAAALMLPDRQRATTWLAHGLVSLIAGILVLIPRLAARGDAEGLHSQLQEVVFVGGGLFVADPLWILRWGGAGSVLALPALLLLALLSRAWIRRPEHRVGLAIALPVWLISLNPLVAPLAWSAVSYLVVRLGRIVLTSWVWVTMAGAGLARMRQGGSGLATGILVGGLGIWGIGHEVTTAWRHLSEPQVADGTLVAQRIDELTNASTGVDWLLTAPRIGYGIRARGGPRLVLAPVAHASPNDRHLLERLARWRELHDPTLGDDELRSRIANFGNVALLVDARTEEIHDGVRSYGYLPDDERSVALDRRLRAMEIPIFAEGDGWTMFSVTGHPAIDTSGDRGTGFEIEAASLGRIEATAGTELDLQLTLRATGDRSVTPRRIFVRLEGDMPAAPEYASRFSKLWRKLFVERSGRSRHRFGQWVAPADLVIPPDRWPQGVFQQSVNLEIPAWAEPGTYTLQITTHEWTWHPSYELRDYLSDVDSYSANPSAILQISR